MLSWDPTLVGASDTGLLFSFSLKIMNQFLKEKTNLFPKKSYEGIWSLPTLLRVQWKMNGDVVEILHWRGECDDDTRRYVPDGKRPGY